MNYKTENIQNADLSETANVEPIKVEKLSVNDEKSPINRTIYIVGSVILVSVAALLIWLFVSRGQAGKAITAPRNVTFNEPTGGNNALTSSEQTLTISPEQLKAASLKIEKVGEGFNQASSVVGNRRCADKFLR